MPPPPYPTTVLATTSPTPLTQHLTRIESTNPTLSSAPGTGEAAIAAFLVTWLSHHGIETHVIPEPEDAGRPSVVGVVRGSGGGRSLMVNGHIDTVSIAGYTGSEALSGSLSQRDGGKEVVVGRGSLDMKSGIAAGMALLVHAKSQRWKGDVILAAVADEEHLSRGTEEVLAQGWRADAAVVTEPTGLGLGVAHKGFVWVEIEVRGVAAHGSMPSEGVDAIAKMGEVLRRLGVYAEGLPTDEVLGKSSLHCGIIKGGEETSSYPARCELTVEVRTVPGQHGEGVLRDIKALLEAIANDDEKFKFTEPRVSFERKPYRIADDHELVELAQEVGKGVIGGEVKPQGVFGWCDAALLGEAGIPSIVFGPKGEGLHGKDEWVEVESIDQTTEVLKRMAERWCN